MVEDEDKGTRPLYRPKDLNIVTRRKEKEKKRHDWSTRGGYIDSMFVAPTPKSELAN